jgi:hypothetical protein
MISRLEGRECVCTEERKGTLDVKIGHAVRMGSRARGSWPCPGTEGRRRRPLPGGPSLNVDKAAGGPEPRVDRLLFDLD